MPTTRAHGYAIVKMCSEFASLGVDIELITPRKTHSDLSGKNLSDNLFSFYNIKQNFPVRTIPSFDFLGKTLRFGKVLFWIDTLSFLLMSKLSVKLKKEDVIYTRDYLVPLFFPSKIFSALELHSIPKNNYFFKKALKRIRWFFVLNKNIQEELVAFGVSLEKIHIFPSGVEDKEFDMNMSKSEARVKLNLPENIKIVLYSGQFLAWKGIDTLAEAAKLVPEAHFIFIGGTEPELSEFRNKYGQAKNMTIDTFKEKSLTPIYRRAADIITVPNSAKGGKISTDYTSPLKLFSAMASKRPIVASRLPSIMEAVTDKECFFAEPDDPVSFASAIKTILNNPELAETISQNAYIKAKQYGWADRAKKILEIINLKL
jgi:glycosyltransferase involved in cell wall biosynthesis